METRQHFHQLEICLAKRTYTFHKKGEVRKFKAGDKAFCSKKVKGLIKQFVFIIYAVKENRLVYYKNNKEANINPKFCKKINSNSLSYIN